jgi:uncharacterized protein YutE (UPF0331/DUF86 family)
MVDRDVLAGRLGELLRRVGRVRQHCPATAAELASDPDRLDLVSFNLMLAVQACLDAASHVIADEGWPAAQDLAGAFLCLHEHGAVSAPVAAALARAAGLRNIVAHVYARLDPQLLHAAATDGLGDLERFAAELSAWAEAQDDRPAPR